MSEQEIIRDLAEDLAGELIDRLGATEIDIENDATGVSIASDEWTMRLEFAGSAWVAIDREPEDVSQFTAARLQSLGNEVEQLLREINGQREGLLVRLLLKSRDPFSINLAQSLERKDE